MSLWQFSKELYQSAGVEECCIGLQDSYGADVNILLLCCWCGERGCGLDQAWFKATLANPELTEWREQCLEPLRRLRRQLKVQSLPGAMALRERVKVLELEAEKLEQDFLLQNLPDEAAVGHGLNLLWQNLKSYWLALHHQQPAMVRFEPLLRAVYPDCSEAELLELEDV
jgi:uncharacterized protein (TIGR02444 family)